MADQSGVLDVNSRFRHLAPMTKLLKHNMFKTVDAAKTGHVGACCSSTELMATLYFTDILKYDIDEPKHPNRDYVLVRGHLGPLRYNIFSLLGWLRPEEMSKYRQIGSRLCGHEDMNITPGVDLTPSGSLGMLLSYAVGAQIGFKRTGRSNKIFCFLGDGEEQEGNVSEAARHASNINCINLIVIIDANKKQLSTSTKFTDRGSDIKSIWEGYGWNVLVNYDGHNLSEVYTTLKAAVAKSNDGPVCVISHTIKGNGLKGALDHYCGYHVYHNNENNNLSKTAQILSGLIPSSYDYNPEDTEIVLVKQDLGSYEEEILPSIDLIKFKEDPEETDRDAYDHLTELLTQLSKLNRRTYVLTADYPPRLLMNQKGQLNIPNLIYMNVGVREQHLCAMAHGLRLVDKSAIIILLCGDAFMYRCSDQINVMAQSHDNIIIYSVQAGLSGAQNGATHQSSGQSGAFITMPGITVYEPASKKDWLYSMNKSLSQPGLKYIRTHKGYSLKSAKEGFYYNMDYGTNPRYVIITSGMTTYCATEAARLLSNGGHNGTVINIVSIKDIKGIGDLVPSSVPIFFIYNGNVEILSSMVCRQLCHEGVITGKIYERGFNLGVTGSISDVMKHFQFDTKSVMTLVQTYS